MSSWGVMSSLGLLGLLACGDPITGADYRGEPILRLTGRIESVGRGVAVPEGKEALVSMFWKTNLSTVTASLVAQDSVSTAITFPSTFEIRVFDPPTTADLVASDGRFGVGLLLVYVDLDGDHHYGPSEPVIGGNLQKALVWADQVIAATESPFATALPEGFSLVKQPFMACMGQMMHEQGHPAPDGGPHVSACVSDATCPQDFQCDLSFKVCVPKDDFELEIGGEFDLNRASCGAQ
ncbi:MAG: hypothetical protein U1E65_34390 [Myxococcota bacterium]